MRLRVLLVIAAVLFLALTAVPLSNVGPNAAAAGTPTASSTEESFDEPISHTVEARPYPTWPLTLAGVRPNRVFYPDDRWPVTEYRSSPWRSVTFLEGFSSELSFILGFVDWTCSGTLVGPDVVLTAAHCVYPPPDCEWPYAMFVTPGQNGADFPWGYSSKLSVWIPRGWGESCIPGSSIVTPEQARYDYAFIVLKDKPLGNTVGWRTMGVFSDQALRETALWQAVGYPGDKSYATMWAASGSLVASQPFDTDRLYTQIDLYAGQSGGPLWRSSDQIVAGIISTESVLRNAARRVTSEVIDLAGAACAQDGCSFSWTTVDAVPTATPIPTSTPTPLPTATSTPVPSSTSAPVPTATSTPTPLAVTPRASLPFIAVDVRP